MGIVSWGLLLINEEKRFVEIQNVYLYIWGSGHNKQTEHTSDVQQNVCFECKIILLNDLWYQIEVTIRVTFDDF